MFKMANELGGELSSTVMRWIQESFYGASNLDSQSAAAAREIFGQNLASDAGMQYYHVNSEERRWIVLNHNDRVPDASLTILFLAAKNGTVVPRIVSLPCGVLPWLQRTFDFGLTGTPPSSDDLAREIMIHSHRLPLRVGSLFHLNVFLRISLRIRCGSALLLLPS
eukprot:GHVU01096791.1.p2 GENE.GHVU01096791.1~~GHVU01096791.1.p2  ORF type:complete len:166 (-),score=10.16 GHVU01096791.1:694-1191(-)